MLRSMSMSYAVRVTETTFNHEAGRLTKKRSDLAILARVAPLNLVPIRCFECFLRNPASLTSLSANHPDSLVPVLGENDPKATSWPRGKNKGYFFFFSPPPYTNIHIT